MSGASGLRILPDQLQDGPFDNPLLIVQSEQLDGDLTNLRQPNDASTVQGVSGGMILPENRRSEIPFFFPGLFFRLFS